jgi:hypothetical protein
MNNYLLFMPDQYGKKYLGETITEAPILITNMESARRMASQGLAYIQTEAEVFKAQLATLEPVLLEPDFVELGASNEMRTEDGSIPTFKPPKKPKK